MWTYFFDYASGGYQKTPHNCIYVELPKKKAVKWFRKRFKQRPDAVACMCCGENFGVNEFEGNPYQHGHYQDGKSLVVGALEAEEDL